MKIVTWNCNGALRKKFKKLIELNADIYVIQECENPAFIEDEDYKFWAANYLWIGETKNKGLGIFAKPHVGLKKLEWPNNYKDHTVKHFLPCSINGSINLLAVWTHQNNSPNFGYIGQFWKYIQTNKQRLDNILIAGDFNSNAIWDEWDRWWNHTDVVKELSDIEIISLYHNYTNEEQGKETQATFYMHRIINRPYHIDYFFASNAIAQRLSELSIGSYKDWISLSDHCPMSINLEAKNQLYFNNHDCSMTK